MATVFKTRIQKIVYSTIVNVCICIVSGDLFTNVRGAKLSACSINSHSLIKQSFSAQL